MRRITTTCPEIKYKFHHANDEYTFGGEVCNAELRIKHESVHPSADSDFIPLQRDFFGRLTPTTGDLYQVLACGHQRVITELQLQLEQHDRHPRLWEKLLPQQRKTVELVENSGFRCYLNYEMATGKTPIALSVLRENQATLGKTLIVCQAGDIWRWQKQGAEWLGAGDFGDDLMSAMRCIPQVIDKNSTNAAFAPVTIVSWTNVKDPKILELIKKRDYKFIIVDEAHMFKNEDAKRTQGLVELCAQVPYVLFLSGTWIENSIAEAFVPLNILDPHYFNSRSALYQHCVVGPNNKPLGLDPYWRDQFFDRTSKYLFRMTLEQMGMPLPPKISLSNGTKTPVWIDPTKFKANESFIKDYNKTLDELAEEMEASKPSFSSILGYMTQLRHWTGKMKVMPAVEYIVMRLMETAGEPKDKIAVGVHHKEVMELLKQLLESVGYEVITMSDENAAKKDAIELEFKTNPRKRIMLCSILGAGIGRNMQFCNKAIVLERMWNKSKEIQFEGRFHRLLLTENGEIKHTFSDEDIVEIEYLMTSGSFDEFFHKLVELKGHIADSMDASIDTSDVPDSEFMYELAREVIKHRMVHVGI